MKINFEINLCFDNYFYYITDQNNTFYDYTYDYDL